MKSQVLTLILCTLAMFATAHAESNFSASTQPNSGTLFTHTTCGGTGCVVDNRISTSSTTGFTTVGILQTVRIGGKTYTTPQNIGSVQFGTGSLKAGDWTNIAVFGTDQSYVHIGTNGSCGQFKGDPNDGVCKNNGYTPNEPNALVGVFVGTISWVTRANGTVEIKGIVRSSIVNGDNNVSYFNFVAHTLPERNEQFAITDITIDPATPVNDGD